jgi:hypothetical protein
VAKVPKKFSKLNSGPLSGLVISGNENRAIFRNKRMTLNIIIITNIQVTKTPLFAMELSKLYLSFAPSFGLDGEANFFSPCEPWPYERSSVLLVIKNILVSSDV